MDTGRTIRLPLILVAIVLLIACAAKLYSIVSNPVWADGWELPSWGVVIIVQVEALLAIWLLSGKLQNLGWFCAVFLFLTFFVFSLVNFVQNGNSCNCFGPTAISPLVSLSINIAILCVLFVRRPGHAILAAKLEITTFFKQLTPSRVGSAVGLVASFFLVTWAFGTDGGRSQLFGLGGGQILIVNGGVNCGSIHPGKWTEVEITVKNNSVHPVEIVGGGTSCGCVTLESIPMSIPAADSQTMHLCVNLERPGQFSKRFVYYLRHPNQRSVLGTITGKIVDE